MKTIAEIRAAFWESNPQFAKSYRKTYRQNDYSATIRSAFVDYVDYLARSGEISEKLSFRATL